MNDIITDIVKDYEILKIVLPLLITLIISIVGWILTQKYNAAQIAIATEKNKADIEIARINAALKYVDLAKDIKNLNADQINQTQTIIAPVLPPELAFELALKSIYSNSTLINVLISKYGEEVPYLVANLFLQFPYDLIPIEHQSFHSSLEYQTYLNNLKEENERLFQLLEVLDQRRLLDEFFDYLVSEDFDYPDLRSNSLFYYYKYLSNRSIETRQENIVFLKRIHEAKALSENESVSDLIKSDILTAVSLVYTHGYGYDGDIPLLSLAAEYFWEGFDVSTGDYPSEKNLKWILYETKFFNKRGEGYPARFATVAVDLTSKYLWGKLDKLNFTALDFEQKRLIIYQYATTTKTSTINDDGEINSHLPFLMPTEIVRLIQKIIASINSTTEKKKMAFELGSLSGHILYKNISRNDEEARQYIESLLSWYEQNYVDDWPTPKFLKDAVLDFPEFEDRVNTLLN